MKEEENFLVFKCLHVFAFNIAIFVFMFATAYFDLFKN